MDVINERSYWLRTQNLPRVDNEQMDFLSAITYLFTWLMYRDTASLSWMILASGETDPGPGFPKIAEQRYHIHNGIPTSSVVVRLG